MQHARLSPSSSSRWLTCTASVEAGEPYENHGNSAAEWGTNTHYIGEQLLTDHLVSVGDTLTEKGRHPFTVDKEMLDCAEEYADYVRSFIDTSTDEVIIEEQYDLSCISEGQFGTSDATVLNGTHLHIFDLKTGHGIVMAESNTQMMLYAIGAVEELESIYDIEMITLHIVQTRAGHLDTWDLHYEDLMKFKAYAQEQAKKILDGKGEFNPTNKACQWCPHKVNCEALNTFVEDTVTGQFDNLEEIEGNADRVNLDHVKKIMDNAELIMGFIKAVQSRALELLEEGQKIEGYKLVESKTNRKWADEEEVAKYLNRKIKAEELWTKKLISMTQILKLRPNDKKLQAMLVKPEGKPQLAPESDKRPAITAVADEFEEC